MSSDDLLYLEVAAELGEKIAESAIWFEDRCNWVGAVPQKDPRGSLTIAALGPDLYGGTSGVALFLAEAGTRLDDDRLRATAIGAIRQALDHADRIHPGLRDGLYLGSIGVAYAAARVAGLLDREEVMAGARELLRAWRLDDTRSASADVMSGCAGGVAGLLALTELVEEPWLVEAAASLGEELIARAEPTASGWSWAEPGRRSMFNLCGFSHGAAGIGHALAELFGVTGDSRFREAAERAADHERSWFDSRTGTWPDLRDVALLAGRDAPIPAADSSWCNGAPGIALARLRAAELLGSAALDRDAILALEACERHVSELVVHAPADFSLCHGAACTGDALLYAADGPEDRYRALAVKIGRDGIERHHGPRATGFPCGMPQGETPGLLLGLAGIGMFYLRLWDPGVDSPLLVHRNGLDSLAGTSIQSHVTAKENSRERAVKEGKGEQRDDSHPGAGRTGAREG
jgi:lantibiotic modifying enzyme